MTRSSPNCFQTKYSLGLPPKEKKNDYQKSETTKYGWQKNTTVKCNWGKNMTKCFSNMFPTKIFLGLPKNKKISWLWKYDCKIWLKKKYECQTWLDVPKICSLLFPVKHFGIPNKCIMYNRWVQGQNMTDSHICSHVFLQSNGLQDCVCE